MPWTQQDEDKWAKLPEPIIRLIVSMARLQQFEATAAPDVMIEGERKIYHSRLKLAGITPGEMVPGAACYLAIQELVKLHDAREEARNTFNTRCKDCCYLNDTKTFFDKLEHCTAYPGEMQPAFITPCTKFKAKR